MLLFSTGVVEIRPCIRHKEKAAKNVDDKNDYGNREPQARETQTLYDISRRDSRRLKAEAKSTRSSRITPKLQQNSVCAINCHILNFLNFDVTVEKVNNSNSTGSWMEH